MKVIRLVLIQICFAVAIPALAQHHGGSGTSNHGGDSRGGGSTPSNRGAGYVNRGGNVGQQRASAPTQRQQITSPRMNSRGNAGIRRSGVVVNNYGNYNRGYNYGGFRRSFWWGGGLYFGSWYGPGWYYPGVWYPGVWYANGWGASYQYGYTPYASVSGIKFDLDDLPKADRKSVSEAGVYLPDSEGKAGYLGAVKNFAGNFHKALPLAAGTHDITVALADGRKIDMSVTVQPQRVTRVTLRFDRPPQEDQPEISATGEQKLVPAPTPAAAPASPPSPE